MPKKLDKKSILKILGDYLLLFILIALIFGWTGVIVFNITCIVGLLIFFIILLIEIIKTKRKLKTLDNIKNSKK
jgi:ABC-type transport system involved in Fe-S cluster assembly fused permease/ATPase subunit